MSLVFKCDRCGDMVEGHKSTLNYNEECADHYGGKHTYELCTACDRSYFEWRKPPARHSPAPR